MLAFFILTSSSSERSKNTSMILPQMREPWSPPHCRDIIYGWLRVLAVK